MTYGYGRVTPEVLERLERELGKARVLSDGAGMEPYSWDETGSNFATMPEVVVRPDTTEDVCAVMRIAHEYRIPVTASAARSGVAGGAVPLFHGIVLTTERMNRILEIDRVNRTATVQPGVVTNDLCKAAAEKGFLYAGSPMSTLTSTIGGNIATNAGGAKGVRYGSTRRHVLALETVLSDGKLLNVGGKYRKGTWGYDVKDLLIGSEGTLGIVTQIVVNLEPLPGKTLDLLAVFGSTDESVTATSKILALGVPLVSCEYLDRPSVQLTSRYVNYDYPFQDRAEAFLLIQLEGKGEEDLEEGCDKVGNLCYAEGAMEVFVADNRSDSAALWSVRQNYAEALRARDPHFVSGDVLVPLSAVPEMVHRIQETALRYELECVICAHIGEGNLHPDIFKPDGMDIKDWENYSERFFADLIRCADELGGIGSGEHGVGFVKMPFLHETQSPEWLALMRRIKEAFDPHWLLNPGKIVGNPPCSHSSSRLDSADSATRKGE